MTRMVSIGTKVAQIAALVGTADVSEWEDRFITDVANLTDSGKVTTALSEKQVVKIEQIWKRHFA